MTPAHGRLRFFLAARLPFPFNGPDSHLPHPAAAPRAATRKVRKVISPLGVLVPKEEPKRSKPWLSPSRLQENQ